MDSPNWQTALDLNLVRRLMRPLHQPGAISPDLGNAIIARIERMTNHLPLLVQFAQRQPGVFQPDQIPIVYAQSSNLIQVVNSHSEVFTEPSTVIQAKLISNITLINSTSDATQLNLDSQNSPIIFTQLLQDTSSQVPSALNQLFQSNSQSFAASVSPSSQPDSQINRFNIVQAKSTSITAPISIEEQMTWRLAQNATAIELHSSDLQSVQGATPPKSLRPPSEELTLRSSQRKPIPPLPVVSVRLGIDASTPIVDGRSKSHLNERAIATPLIFTHANATPTPRQPTSSFPSQSPSDFREPYRTRLEPHFSASLTETASSDAPKTPLNIDALTTQVERKLMRRLVIESERRGHTRWR